MKRRAFIKSSVAVASAAAASPLLAAEPSSSRGVAPELYELRMYRLRRGPMQKRFDDFYREAAVPAMNRAGITPVGVFSVAAGSDTPAIYALLPHKTADSFLRFTERIRSDADFQKLGAEFINATPTDPSYVRVEGTLMIAFDGIPKLEVPAATATKQSRLFELRTYESHSERASKKKIEMFNNGEIAIFRKTGLAPVFFGETLVGNKMPSLTYMLVFQNMAERDKNWGTFVADPEWKKLSTTPGYTDPEIVSNISNVFLRPTPYSQI